MPISGILKLPFLCPAWPQGEHTKQAWTSFTPTLLLDLVNTAREGVSRSTICCQSQLRLFASLDTRFLDSKSAPDDAVHSSAFESAAFPDRF
jgi:hypothetical protein